MQQQFGHGNFIGSSIIEILYVSMKEQLANHMSKTNSNSIVILQEY
jgi:hypothetical protein